MADYDVMDDASEESHSGAGIKILRNTVDCSEQKTGGMDDAEVCDVFDMSDLAGWYLVGLMHRMITPDADAIGITLRLGTTNVVTDLAANAAAKTVAGGMLAAGFYIDGTANINLIPAAGDSNLTAEGEIIAVLVR